MSDPAEKSSNGRKWKPGQLEKFRKTMKARAKALKVKAKAKSNGATKHSKHSPPSSSEALTDAIVFLRHAESFINQSLNTGRIKKEDEAHLWMKVALRKLEG